MNPFEFKEYSFFLDFPKKFDVLSFI